MMEKHGTLSSYLWGFILSLVLTLAAYYFAIDKIFVGALVCALLEVLVVLFFFLQIGHEKSPRQKLYLFISMVIVGAIVIIGTLIIMNNLNKRTMIKRDTGMIQVLR